jgi:hypothetical protein
MNEKMNINKKVWVKPEVLKVNIAQTMGGLGNGDESITNVTPFPTGGS